MGSNSKIAQRTMNVTRYCARRRWRRPSASCHPRSSSSVTSAKVARDLLVLLGHKPGSVLTPEGKDHLSRRLAKYNEDWTNRFRGHSTVVARPSSTEEVASVLTYCNSKGIGVVPQAGNTGLVGGSVPLRDELILSVERMNQIEGMDEDTGILKCQAGCILQVLQDYAVERKHLVPVDLGAKGTCQIGGNVSTNAGGSYYYRYGSLHANVLGLEVVLPNGQVVDLSYRSTNLKDNVGYDLKHLFIGAEGTLGVVTKVAILCPRAPGSRCAAFLACQTFDQVRKTLQLAKRSLGEILAAFEFLDHHAMNMIANHGIESPLEDKSSPYCLLVETHGSLEEHDAAKMERFLELAMEEECVSDGILAQDLSQVDQLWRVRESANPSVAALGYVYKYDVSLPVKDFPLFISEMRDRISSGYPKPTLNGNWGHVIDGNLHFNVTTPGEFERDEKLLNIIEPYLFESVIRRGGSISAEHGLGQCKNNHLPMARDEASINGMKALKSLFDPNGIMNPGKFLPTD